MHAGRGLEKHLALCRPVRGQREPPHPRGEAEEPGEVAFEQVEPPLVVEVEADRHELADLRDRADKCPLAAAEPPEREARGIRRLGRGIERTVLADGERLDRAVLRQALEGAVGGQVLGRGLRGVIGADPVIALEGDVDAPVRTDCQTFGIAARVLRERFAVAVAQPLDRLAPDGRDPALVAQDAAANDRRAVRDRDEAGAVLVKLQPGKAAVIVGLRLPRKGAEIVCCVGLPGEEGEKGGEDQRASTA